MWISYFPNRSLPTRDDKMKLSVKNMQNIYQAFKGYRQTATSNPADCLVYLVLVSYAAVHYLGRHATLFPISVAWRPKCRPKARLADSYQSLAECHNRYNRSVHLHLNFTDFFNSLRYACIALNSTSPSSRLGRVRKILQPTRFLYYFDEKKERVIYLLLLLLFIIDINNAYMEGAVYVYVFHLLVSIQATLAFEELTFLFSVLLSLLLLLLTCFIFAHVNVNSFCSYSVYGDIYYVPVC